MAWLAMGHFWRGFDNIEEEESSIIIERLSHFFDVAADISLRFRHFPGAISGQRSIGSWPPWALAPK